jgi:hypothetical protein
MVLKMAVAATKSCHLGRRPAAWGRSEAKTKFIDMRYKNDTYSLTRNQGHDGDEVV